MRQFRKIFGFEFKNYLQNKVFVGVTVVLVAAMAIVMFSPRVMEALGSGPGGAAEDVGAAADGGGLPIMLVVGEGEQDAEAIAQAFSGAFASYEVRSYDGDAEAVREQIVSGEAACAFIIESPLSYTYYVGNLSMYDSNTMVASEVLQGIYRQNAMVESGLDPQDASAILETRVSGTIENLGMDQAQNFFYTYIMIFALYMVIMIYGQMVATSVASEKSSRAMELLITTADPTSMIFGKVMASCLAGLLQIVAVFGSALLFFHLNSSYWGGVGIVESIFGMPGYLLAYMLVFFMLGYLIYAFMYGAVGSTVSKLEDINTAVMPITLVFIAGFFVSIFSMTGGDVDNMLVKACSFIPITSPMAMFTRIAMTTVPAHEIAISIAILIVAAIGIGVLSAKIYRVGVLLYGTRPKLGSLLKSLGEA